MATRDITEEERKRLLAELELEAFLPTVRLFVAHRGGLENALPGIERLFEIDLHRFARLERLSRIRFINEAAGLFLTDCYAGFNL